MKYEIQIKLYSMVTAGGIAILANVTKYDWLWVIFTFGGISIMLGHLIFDKKIKHSAGKITWMIITSFIFCLLIKFYYDEKKIDVFSMVISTLIVSMIAPATISILLQKLPEKVSEQILSLPEFLMGILKSKVENQIGKSSSQGIEPENESEKKKDGEY